MKIENVIQQHQQIYPKSGKNPPTDIVLVNLPVAKTQESSGRPEGPMGLRKVAPAPDSFEVHGAWSKEVQARLRYSNILAHDGRGI